MSNVLKVQLVLMYYKEIYECLLHRFTRYIIVKQSIDRSYPLSIHILYNVFQLLEEPIHVVEDRN